MLTAKQHQLLLFIHERLETTGVSPSFDEMKDALGLKSKSGVHRLVNALEERGFIKRLANRARALEVLETAEKALHHQNKSENTVITGTFTEQRQETTNTAVCDIPLHGRIAAGTPIEAIENADSRISVPAHIANDRACFALEVSGDSMIEKGILDGDLVVIESCKTARDGEIVVALVDREEATLKTLVQNGKFINLVPANRDYLTQSYEAGRVQVQGRLIGLVRQYH